MIRLSEISERGLTLKQKEELFNFLYSQIEKAHGEYVYLTDIERYLGLQINGTLKGMAQLMKESNLVQSLEEGRGLTERLDGIVLKNEEEAKITNYGIHGLRFNVNFPLFHKLLKRKKEPTYVLTGVDCSPNMTIYD